MTLGEAELYDGIYKSKSSPIFHLKVIRDNPTESCKLQFSPSPSWMSMFLSNDEENDSIRLMPEVHLVEIDNVRAWDLLFWNDQYRIGRNAAIEMVLNY